MLREVAARIPLRARPEPIRTIRRQVEDPAAELLLSGELKAGDTLRLCVEAGAVKLRPGSV